MDESGLELHSQRLYSEHCHESSEGVQNRILPEGKRSWNTQARVLSGNNLLLMGDGRVE